MTTKRNSEPFETYVTVVRETAKALLVDGDDLPRKTWLPKSQILDDGEIDPYRAVPGDEGMLLIPMWLAVQEEWADEDDVQDAYAKFSE